MFLKRRELHFEANHAPGSMVRRLVDRICSMPPSSAVLTLPPCTGQLLGDLVGRGEQALVLGGLDGSLAVFKVRVHSDHLNQYEFSSHGHHLMRVSRLVVSCQSLDSTEPCALASNLGGIRVLVIGTLGQGRHQRRLLVAITADSTVHGFDFSTFRPTPRKGQLSSFVSLTSVAP